MVAPTELIGLAFVAALHTAIAAVATRFFRIHLDTRWGTAVYAAVFVPLLLVVSTLVLTGALGLGAGLGDRRLALVVVFAAPLVLGYSIELFWMPAPEEIELPEADGESNRS